MLERRDTGLGEALDREVIENGPGSHFRWLLHTADAPERYRKFNFVASDTTYMEWRRGRSTLPGDSKPSGLA